MYTAHVSKWTFAIARPLPLWPKEKNKIPKNDQRYDLIKENHHFLMYEFLFNIPAMSKMLGIP